MPARTRPARPGAAACASPSVTAASGLRPSGQHASGGPVPRAAGIGCATASQSRGLAADRPGKTGEGRRRSEKVATDEARSGCGRSSSGRCRTQGPRQWVSKSLAGGPLGEKSALNSYPRPQRLARPDRRALPRHRQRRAIAQPGSGAFDPGCCAGRKGDARHAGTRLHLDSRHRRRRLGPEAGGGRRVDSRPEAVHQRPAAQCAYWYLKVPSVGGRARHRFGSQCARTAVFGRATLRSRAARRRPAKWCP